MQLTKEQRQAKRIRRAEIMQELNLTGKERCEKCKYTGLSAQAIDCDCPAAIKILKLGKDLDNLTAVSREQRAAELFQQGRNEWNIALYLLMKEHGLNDKQIVEGIGVNKRLFNAWLKDNGIMRGRITELPQVEIPLERGK